MTARKRNRTIKLVKPVDIDPVLCYKKDEMEKKDIYEHLAKIYLDTPLRRDQVNKEKPRESKHVVFIGIAVVLVVFLFLVSFALTRGKNITLSSQVTHVLHPEVIKIGYSFNPSQKQLFSINLNKQNLVFYHVLEFSGKKSNYMDSLALRVEFVNAFNEKSEIYIRDLTNKWQAFKINLDDFKQITDWTEMSSVSFIIEEWNALNKDGAVYLDNVRLLH
ncbi:MAG: hypothetical protein WDL87_00215 [Candidatus Omnitrophota bacterium]|jgi:hypothetical protein